MPVSEQDFIFTAPAININFAPEPVFNMLHSLCLLNRSDRLSGLDSWVTQTIAKLTPKQCHANRLVCEGFHYAIQPTQSWTGFPLYLDYLAAQSPFKLRDRIFDTYTSFARKVAEFQGKPISIPDQKTLLTNSDAFITFLQTHLPSAEIDVALEREAHVFLNDPLEMHRLILSHLRRMWQQYLAPEWQRIEANIQESVLAFQQINWAGLTPREITQTIIEGELDERWDKALTHANNILFIPSVHIGPYASKFFIEDKLGIFFRAQLPKNISFRSTSPLTRSELLVRFSALTDDNRLHILKLLATKGELCAPEIIAHLNLSQSAASRHLRQLTATGYLSERRQDGAKCYTLVAERFDETFRAFAQFLEIE